MISHEYAALSAASNVVNTRASNLAKDIRGSDRIMALVVLALSTPSYFVLRRVFPSSFWLVLLPTLMKLLIIGSWYAQFLGFTLGNADYFRAKEGVGRSARLWIAILTGQIIVIIAIRRLAQQ